MVVASMDVAASSTKSDNANEQSDGRKRWIVCFLMEKLLATARSSVAFVVRKMSHTTFNIIGTILGVAAHIALCVALYSVILMFVRWKRPERRRHFIRLVNAAIAVPCFIGIHFMILFFVVLPTQGREQMAEINAGRAAKLAETSVVQIGDPAPDFSITTANGELFSLADARGDIILINFFATWCGPCQVELPHIERIWTENRNNKCFRLLVIGREESEEFVRGFCDKHGFTFPIAADPNRAVYSLFAKELVPRTLIVSPEGLVVYSKAGFVEDDIEELNLVLAAQFAARP